jgi:hypothetical protein
MEPGAGICANPGFFIYTGLKRSPGLSIRRFAVFGKAKTGPPLLAPRFPK